MSTLVRHDRPRDLRWYLAGPMFFGDLGTSRLYVLGLAFFYAGVAAPWFVAAVCALVFIVGWAYTVVCRVNPDGGGVYSSGRMIHPTLGAIGAFLLMANYVVTAAISTYEAVIYIGGPFGMERGLAPLISVVAIALIGVLNYVGPKRAGAFALIVALASVGITAVLAALTIQHLPEGWRVFLEHGRPSGGTGNIWLNLVAVVLALSGVESIANMTGIMVKPVKRTAKRAIWPVVGEVVLLNLVLVIIVCSLPGLPGVGSIANKERALDDWKKLPAAEQQLTERPPEITHAEHELTERVLHVVARHYVGDWFAAVSSIIFGLLLLSATNTAVLAMVSIQYAMSRDRELPAVFSRLNQFGVPWYGLIGACLLPAIVTLVAGDVTTLAKLYAIGVVGAIVINLMSCAFNGKLDILALERVGMWIIAAILGSIWITIATTNHSALLFLVVMLSGGMALRGLAKAVPTRVPVPAAAAGEVAGAEEELAELLPFAPDKGRVLVATRGNLKLLRFALDEARQRASNLFVLFVRDISVSFPGQERPMTLEEDREAAVLFKNAREMAAEQGVPLQPIYCVSPLPADVILDFAATYAADLVILGVSRRTGVLRALRGDVISGVADHLPDESTLLIHAA
ncbi:MAG: universal stress protein [Planctomycetes bacterium]|nr:universal stress protein [Planctomycetota bacterium]